ncbi:MAG: hypothetical protein BWY13_00148 [Euryarchaeota archaeon ADurb.Bin190]|nr:MAG: hypothetical protein BWY13_00148 [Euryarchaeota archaeon ADurb.Bin190]
MMLMVPVGAMVVTVEFLMAAQPFRRNCSKSGKEPRSSPSRAEARRASWEMKLITFSAMATACGER